MVERSLSRLTPTLSKLRTLLNLIAASELNFADYRSMASADQLTKHFASWVAGANSGEKAVKLNYVDYSDHLNYLSLACATTENLDMDYYERNPACDYLSLRHRAAVIFCRSFCHLEAA